MQSSWRHICWSLGPKCCSLNCQQHSLQRNTGRELIKVSALLHSHWASLTRHLIYALTCSRFQVAPSPLPAFDYKQGATHIAGRLSSAEKMWVLPCKTGGLSYYLFLLRSPADRFGMGSSKTHSAVLFHCCPLSSTWGHGGCIPLVY